MPAILNLGDTKVEQRSYMNMTLLTSKPKIQYYKPQLQSQVFPLVIVGSSPTKLISESDMNISYNPGYRGSAVVGASKTARRQSCEKHQLVVFKNIHIFKTCQVLHYPMSVVTINGKLLYKRFCDAVHLTCFMFFV